MQMMFVKLKPFNGLRKVYHIIPVAGVTNENRLRAMQIVNTIYEIPLLRLVRFLFQMQPKMTPPNKPLQNETAPELWSLGVAEKYDG